MAKKKNLDNLQADNNDLEQDILSEHRKSEKGEPAFDLDSQDDILDDDDDDFHFEFESDDDDDESQDDDNEPDFDDEDEPDDESDSDDSEEDDEDEEPRSKSRPKQTSKQEKAIVALKREQKRLREENQRMQRQLAKRKSKNEADNLVKQYVSEGQDEETAKRMAQQELMFRKQQERLDILEFKDSNADVLAQYPGALRDAAKIKKLVEVGDISVEQACRGLYGTHKRPDYEDRARSRIGADDDYDDDSISRASRGSRQPTKTGLTALQKRQKAFIEKRFLDGEKMSDKDFMQKYKQYMKG